MIDSSLVTGAGIVAALASDTGKKLVGPVAEQIGHALADVAGIYRYYQNQNLGKIFTKWAESRSDKPPLTEEEFKRIVPLLPLASVQCDDDLQARWAALLEYTSATTDGSAFPSFGQTLSELSPEEAKFLDRLFPSILQAASHPLSKGSPTEVPMLRQWLIHTYDSSIKEPMGISYAEAQRIAKNPTPEDSMNLKKIENANLIIQDFVRLGILLERHNVEPDAYIEIPHSIAGHQVDWSIAGKKIPSYASQNHLRSDYHLSPYGLSFIRAVSPKPSHEEK